MQRDPRPPLTPASTFGRAGHVGHGAGRLLLGSIAALLLLVACGGGSGDGEVAPGTVAIRNETDLGMAPLTIEQFFPAPVGRASGGNRLSEAIPPGGVVILGPFPAGLYNASAVLEGGTSVELVDEEILPGEPKNFIVP